MIILFALMMLFIGAIFHFEPLVETDNYGHTLLTYRSNRRTKQRKQIKLW